MPVSQPLLLGLVLTLVVACNGRSAWRQLAVSSTADTGVVPEPRYASAGAYCEGLDLALIVGGFAKDRVYLSDVWGLNLHDNTWEKAREVGENLPMGRYGHSLNVIYDRSDGCDLICLGGELEISEVQGSQKVFLMSIFRDDQGLLQVEWDPLTVEGFDYSKPYAFHSAQIREQRLNVTELYLFGSEYRKSKKGVMEKIELSLKHNSTGGTPQVQLARISTVETGAFVPPNLWASGSAVMDDNIIISGGLQVDQEVEDREVSTKGLWIFNLQNQSWSMPPGRQDGAQFLRHGQQIVAFKDHIVLFGGMRQHYQTSSANSLRLEYFFDTVLVTSPLRDNPRELCQESSSQVVESDDYWCMYGGVEIGNVSALEKGNVAMSQPDCRMMFSAMRRKDTMLVFGGRSNDRCSAYSELLRNDAWELNLTVLLEGNFMEAEEEVQPEFSVLISSLYFFIGLLTVSLMLFCIQFARRQPAAEETIMWGTVTEPRHRGASISLIDRLPEITFRDSGSTEEVCPICLVEFCDQEKLIVLPCNHMYHRECATEWLIKNDTCPLCKRSIHAPASGSKGCTVFPSLNEIVEDETRPESDQQDVMLAHEQTQEGPHETLAQDVETGSIQDQNQNQNGGDETTTTTTAAAAAAPASPNHLGEIQIA